VRVFFLGQTVMASFHLVRKPRSHSSVYFSLASRVLWLACRVQFVVAEP
jgi:hypothetical protein